MAGIGLKERTHHGASAPNAHDPNFEPIIHHLITQKPYK